MVSVDCWEGKAWVEKEVKGRKEVSTVIIDKYFKFFPPSVKRNIEIEDGS